jgi:hypothetical protein
LLLPVTTIFAIEMNEAFISITFSKKILRAGCCNFAQQKIKDENFNGVPGKYLPESFGRGHFEAQG